MNGEPLYTNIVDETPEAFVKRTGVATGLFADVVGADLDSFTDKDGTDTGPYTDRIGTADPVDTDV